MDMRRNRIIGSGRLCKALGSWTIVDVFAECLHLRELGGEKIRMGNEGQFGPVDKNSKSVNSDCRYRDPCEAKSELFSPKK